MQCWAAWRAGNEGFAMILTNADAELDLCGSHQERISRFCDRAIEFRACILYFVAACNVEAGWVDRPARRNVGCKRGAMLYLW